MYIDLRYRPKDDVVCKFHVEATDLKKAAEALAAESSIGTWTDVRITSRIRRMRARVFKIDFREKEVWIAYPLALFEPGNIPQLLSTVAGNIFGMKIVRSLRLEDILFPRKYVKSFKGPRYGIDGVRRLLRVKKRPLVGTIVKPKLGLKTKEHAKVAFEAWVGGCDLVKDDENLTNQSFNPFKERVVETLKARDAAERETGERKAYLPNITAPYDEMVKRLDFVKAHGGRYVMVDVLTVGFSALQEVRKTSLAIHAHRAMHAAITRGKQGISMRVLAKLCRLAGVDQLHIGTVFGKMEGGRKEVLNVRDALTERGLKTVFPVCSGGLHPALVSRLVKLLGNDITIQMGGGIHAHPQGTMAGARAARQAIDLSLGIIDRVPKELKEALRKWKT